MVTTIFDTGLIPISKIYILPNKTFDFPINVNFGDIKKRLRSKLLRKNRTIQSQYQK